MAKTDPSTWSTGYARRHEQKCVAVLEMLTAAMQNALRQREYLAAGQCCNKLCDGLACMVGALGADAYGPMLYTYSFILAQIALFGIGGERGLQAAVPCLQDALDCALDCAKPGRRTQQKAAQDAEMISNVLTDLQNGVSVTQIKEKYYPDFPEYLLP